MKLCLLNYNLATTWSLDQLIRTAIAMGGSAIELRIERGFAAGLELETSRGERRRIRQRVASAGLEIACLGSSSRFDAPDPDERRLAVEHTKRLIELAADVGCHRLRVFGDRVPQGTSPFECARCVGDCLHTLGEFAEPFRVDVLLEMHGDFHDIDLSLTAVETASHLRVALLFNCDMRDLRDGSVAASYYRVRHWIRHIHLHELVSGFPYRELFALLNADGYQGFLSTELEEELTTDAFLLTYATLFQAWTAETLREDSNGSSSSTSLLTVQENR